MHTLLFGINHNTAKVEVREKMHFSDLPDALSKLTSYANINAAVILSTCNRVEIYVTAHDVEKGFDDITQFISDYHGLDVPQYSEHIYKCACGEAVKHLFHVVSSLDSMVLGEMQIQGQVRDAYHAAKDANSTDSVLNKLFQTAIQVGKRIRTETAIGEGAVSVGSVAVDLIKELFSEHPRFKALLIGAGKMSELTAKSLQRHNNCEIFVCNRSKENAIEFGKKFNAKIVKFEDRYQAISECDVVVVSTRAQEPIIRADMAETILSQSKTATTSFIDLSVPRNVAPELDSLDSINVYSVDNLKEILKSNAEKRQDEVDSVIEIVSDLVKDYSDWYAMQTVVPVMKGLKSGFHDLGLRMLDGHLPELGEISDDQKAILQKLMENYSDKIIRIIMKNLQQVTDTGDLAKIANTLKHTFSLDMDNQSSAPNKCPHGHGKHSGMPPHGHGKPHGHP